MSLDGYVADKNGNFDWAQPAEELHSSMKSEIEALPMQEVKADGRLGVKQWRYQVAVGGDVPGRHQAGAILSRRNVA